MEKFLQEYYFDNTLFNLLISFGVVFFVLLFNKIISRIIAGLIFLLVKRIWKNIDRKTFSGLLIHPLGVFIIVIVSLVMFHRLRFPGRWDVEIYQYTGKQVFHAIGTIILIISFSWLLVRLIDFIASLLERNAKLTADQSDNQLILFFKDFLKVIIGISGFLMILHFALHFDVGNLLTGLSIVGAAIALALRESLENLIASFVIFFDKPFTTGDLVKVQGITGTVEKIGLRSTRIRTDQKTFVTVPNKQMVDSILDNLSLRTQRKAEIRLEVDLKTSAEKLAQLSDGIKRLLKDEEIISSQVWVESITASSYLVQGEYFTAAITIDEFIKIKTEKNLSILKLLEAMDISVAGTDKTIRIIEQKQS